MFLLVWRSNCAIATSRAWKRGMGVGPAVGNNKRGMWDAGEVPSAFVLRLGISPCCGLASWHPQLSTKGSFSLAVFVTANGLKKTHVDHRWVKFPWVLLTQMMVVGRHQTCMQELSHFIILLHICSCIIEELRLICASVIFVLEPLSSKCKGALS